MESVEHKKILRTEFKEKAKHIRLEDLAKKSERVCLHLASHPHYKENKTFGFYSALPHEASLESLFSKAIAHEKNMMFPKYDGGRKILFYSVTKEEDLEPGAFGIFEPNSRCTLVPIDSIDVFFVPGICFDSFGNRLGSGLGCYDEALKHARSDAVFIGVAFSFQLLSHRLPIDDHDVPMHFIATEEGVVKTER